MRLPDVMTLRRPSAAAVAAILLAVTGCQRAEEARAAAAVPAGAASAPAPVAVARVAVEGDTALLRRADAGRITGDSAATVWLIMISDFQCPYCKTWHDSTYPAIDREYVRTGKIRLAYLNLPLPSHRHAWPAAEAAMCAGLQGRFWQVHDGIFDAQAQWARLADAAATFEGIATRAGVEPTAWRSCMSTHATRALVGADAERAEQAGINSTPSFIVGGRLIRGAHPASTFRPLIDSALVAAGRGAGR